MVTKSLISQFSHFKDIIHLPLVLQFCFLDALASISKATLSSLIGTDLSNWNIIELQMLQNGAWGGKNLSRNLLNSEPFLDVFLKEEISVFVEWFHLKPNLFSMLKAEKGGRKDGSIIRASTTPFFFVTFVQCESLRGETY